MSFDWGHFRTVASALVKMLGGLPDQEMRDAVARTSIGRSYYAVYHPCLRVHEHYFGRIDRELGGGSHERLLTSLKLNADAAESESERTAGSDVVSALGRLRDLRVYADYHSPWPERGKVEWIAGAAVEYSEQVDHALDEWKRILDSHT